MSQAVCATTRQPYRGEHGWYISPTGSDDDRGDRDEPLLSWQEAQQRILKFNKFPSNGPSESLTIKVYPGEYATPFVLSGSNFDFVQVIGVDGNGDRFDNSLVDVHNLATPLPQRRSVCRRR